MCHPFTAFPALRFVIMDRTDATSQSGRAILMDEKDATSEGGRTVVMDQVDATSETSSATSETMERNKDVDNGNDNGVAAGNDIADVRLFNDIHFAPTAPSPTDHVWAPFPQLPTELRLHIWLLFLRRHRMIEVGIRPDEDEDGTAYPGEIPSMSRFYARHNHLGKRVSGRGYTLVLKGGQGFATALNPLLWVNSEARQMALGFYRVHLPFPGRDGDQLLYLNPEYDVLHAWPAYVYRTYTDDTPIAPMPSAATLLVDLLCDLRAYDPKDRGIANLALCEEYRHILFEDYSDHWGEDEDEDDQAPLLTPSMVHPVAAASFASILRSRLRSVLCVVHFRDQMRGIPEVPTGTEMRHHFAQALPLRRRGLPAGAFDWLETDPRPAVDVDLRQLSLAGDPRPLAHGWKRLEKAFGVGGRAKDNDFRLYICPTLKWSPRLILPRGRSLTLGQSSPPPKWSRAELAQHLREEAEDWLTKRQLADRLLGFLAKVGLFTGPRNIPRHGLMVDAETFERWERAPTTAVGMWLFPAEAFQEMRNVRSNLFDVSGVRPGLVLFDVGD